MASFRSPLWSRPGKEHIYFLKDGSWNERDILGLKGSNLCEMHKIGLPVPYAFTIHSQCSMDYHKSKEMSKTLLDEIKYAVKKLETKSGGTFGGVTGSQKPLLLSVRSSSAVPMPGMMQTVLNLGMNKKIANALTEQTSNSRWALSTYMKFMEQFGIAVMGIDPARYQAVKDLALSSKSAPLEPSLSVEDIREIIEQYKLLAPIPGDPWDQLILCVEAAFKGWYSPRAVKYRDMHNISNHFGAAVTVQVMVFGNNSLLSGAGRMLTRNPNTGEKVLYGEYMANAEGGELREHKRLPMPLQDVYTEQEHIYNNLTSAAQSLEKHFKDAQEVEFTVENMKLYVLGTKKSNRSERAAVKIAVDMVAEGIVTEREALLHINPGQMEFFAFPMIQDEYWSYKEKNSPHLALGRGKAAGGGAVVGKLAFTTEQAVQLWQENQTCIFVAEETDAQSMDALRAAGGTLTFQGGLSSHAACTMRAMSKAVVVDCGGVFPDWTAQTLTSTKDANQVAHTGDLVTIDGSSGWVYIGEKPITLANQDVNFQTVISWADKFKRMTVLTTAYSLEDIITAKRLGSEGIGLFHTCDMFLKEGRAELFLRFILTDDVTQRSQWLLQLQPLLQQDFLELFQVLGNCELGILLLDPPLHQFLPNASNEDFEEQVNELSERLQLDPTESLRRARELQSINPSLGCRGCRLSMAYPEITEMQTRAIVGAAIELNNHSCPALPHIVLPFLCSSHEAERVASLVSTISDSVCARTWTEASASVQAMQCKLACMLDTPRACYQADAISRTRCVSDVILSTDSLTSLVFGMKEECSGEFMDHYLAHHLIAHNPFQVLDQQGVGNLLLSATKRIHTSGTGVKIGVTGKHTGDPSSIAFFDELGVNYLCCTPQSVPVAKVAAAQASIKDGMKMASAAKQPMFRMF